MLNADERMVCIAAVNPACPAPRGRGRESGLNRPHVWQFGGKMSRGKGGREKANPIDVEEGEKILCILVIQLK